MKTAYVLITAARNEEKYIEKTIQSVVAQTVLPQKWVIVSDGSTDNTDEIVRQYAKEYEFIQLLRLELYNNRNWPSQVYAQKTGISQLEGIEYEFLGLLDADISFEPDYYENVLREFQKNPKLGIAGGVLVEPSRRGYFSLVSSPWSVSGPIQMFRRQCYEAISYIPVKRGGHDAVAETKARMRGWEVESFQHLKVIHHRRMGTAAANIFVAKFEMGLREYFYGNHPAYEVAKCCYRIFEKPYVLGSLFRMVGFCLAPLLREKREVGDDVVEFMRREQIQRLYEFFSNKRKQIATKWQG